MSYIYSASGSKLATKVDSLYTYYRGSFIYNGDELDHIIHPEGLIRKASGGYVYYYAKTDHLGSTRVVCHEANGQMKADQITDYYPFGLLHHNNGTNVNRYLFSGKELQDQTVNGKTLQLYDFGARNYDPVLGRWFNIDPALQFTNPYIYCANNPVMYVDPDGRLMSPIYDREGGFLGTDDQGLDGDPIFMDETDFKQGMDHSTAVALDMGFGSLQDGESIHSFLQHYQNIPNRPDFDGVLTLGEANAWYRNGNGQPLYVDRSKIDLGSTTIQSIFEGSAQSVNLLTKTPFTGGLVYGNISVQIENYGIGEIRLGNGDVVDNYGFEMHKVRGFGDLIRNALTIIGRGVAGWSGTPYDIRGYGRAIVPVFDSEGKRELKLWIKSFGL